MDHTYPTGLVLSAGLSLFISVLMVVTGFLAKRQTPRGYFIYIAFLVTVVVVAVSLRRSDWRRILLRVDGLRDLAYIFALIVGALAGTFPLWLSRRR